VGLRRISGMFCSFCADAGLRSREQKAAVTKLASFSRHPLLQDGVIHMLRRIGIIGLWLLAAFLIVI
jgi:hypothetical protein